MSDQIEPTQAAEAARRDLPVQMPGHWDTPEGRDKAAEYLDQPRETLTKGHLSDLALANAQFLASRQDLDLIVWQTAAKERIRWLSAQLAAAHRQSEYARGLEDAARACENREYACPECPDIIRAMKGSANG